MNRELLLKKISLALLWVYAFFTPTFIPIITIGFFMTADLLLALIVCVRTGEKIVSRKMYRTAVKFAAAGIIVMVAHVVCTHYLPRVPGVEIVSGYLILVELKSIDEKGEKVFGVSALKWALDKIRIRNEKLEK